MQLKMVGNYLAQADWFQLHMQPIGLLLYI